MRVDYSIGKYTPDMDKFGSVADRMYMKLGSKFSKLKLLQSQEPVLKGSSV
jgi:hypothetical protein